MGARRTPDPLRVLIVTATLVAAGCGAFESPVPASDGVDPHATDVSIISPYEIVPCTIAPTSASPGWTAGTDAPFRVTPARGNLMFAQFAVVDAPPDIPFRWWLDPDGGVLPPGVALDEQMGEINGNAEKSGDFSVLLRAESVGVHEGRRYVAAPFRVPIEVKPACLSDADCPELLGFSDFEFHCQPDVFSKGGSGGVCTMPQKDTTCPLVGEGERFQVWLQEAEILKPGKAFEVSGEVTSHRPCTTSVFSPEAGGQKGYCLEIRVDTPESGEALARPYVEISYRLPHNYPAPIVEGGHYTFHYIRGNDYAWDHTTDGTLLVFGSDLDGGVDPRLILLGHTGRLLPHHLLTRCRASGSCPELADSQLVPSVCAPVASSSCGASRTPAVLVTRLRDGGNDWAELNGPPIALAGTPGNGAYSLHVALSDTFIGDLAASCEGEEDDYRLSYYVLPTEACALGRVAAVDPPALPAPTRLVVTAAEDFSPAGRPLAFDWEVVLQPAANALFAEQSTPYGARSRIVNAYVPGLYDIRGTAVDGAGTPACGVDDTVRYAVEPPTGAYVELSHDLPAALELRVAPVGTPFDVFSGQAEDALREVASPANLSPDWRVPWTEESVPFTQVLAAELVPGAGVQWFGPPEAIGGRYRVGVLYRGKGRAGAAATAYVRVIVNRNIDLVFELEQELEPCLFWEAGVLDLSGLQPTFDVSTHAPGAVCGEDDVIEHPFKPAAAHPSDAGSHEAASEPTEIAPAGAFDTLPTF